MRTGFPEVVYGPGKSTAQLAEITERLYERSGVILVTRTDAEGYAAVKSTVPDAQFNKLAGIVWADRRPLETPIPGVAVVTAGTSDLPVAEEAAVVAEFFGHPVERYWDVGVAGIHRILNHLLKWKHRLPLHPLYLIASHLLWKRKRQHRLGEGKHLFPQPQENQIVVVHLP
mgnify:CR=1 FL=1